MSKRIFDILIALFLSTLLLLPALVIAFFIRITSPGPILYWSNRMGKNDIIFAMPKFRTMRTDTPALATHLLDNPNSYLTPTGSFLRKTSLDELPQLWSILKGHMSLVGPRPALFNQEDLIQARTQVGVHVLLPGITGLAQVNGRDELSIPEKVCLDTYYLHHKSLLLDLKIILTTIIKVFRRDGITH